MSRAMGSSWVFTCWGAASWHGGRVMSVLGARGAAGAGSCASARGSARFDVVVVCGCSLVAVPAGGAAPVRGSGCSWWWALSWPVVCAIFRGGAGGGGAVRSRRGAASFLCWWAVVSHAPGWGRGVRCGMVLLGCVVAFPVGGGAPCPGLMGRVVARGWSSGGVGQPRAVSRSSFWRVSVRGPCEVILA